MRLNIKHCLTNWRRFTDTKNGLLLIAYFNQFVHWFILGILFPIMSLLQLDRGLSKFHIGITLASYSFTTLIFEIPSGLISDMFGRKRTYLISLVFFVLCGTTMLVPTNFSVMLLGFVFMGMARAFSSGSIEAWLIDEFYYKEPTGNIQPVLAKMGIFITAGLGLGSLAGGFIPDYFSKYKHLLAGFDNYSFSLLTFSILSVVQFLLSAVLIKENRVKKQKTKGLAPIKQNIVELKSSLILGIKNRTISLLLLSTLAWGFAVSGLELFWQPQLKSILSANNSKIWVFGIISTGYFMAAAIGNLLSISICKLFKNNYTIILLANRFLISVLLFSLALQNKLFGFITFYWILFLFNGIAISPQSAVYNTFINSENRSALLSCDSFFLQAGSMTGAIVLGYIANTYAISSAWILSSVVLVLSCFSYVFLNFKGSIRVHNNNLKAKEEISTNISNES